MKQMEQQPRSNQRRSMSGFVLHLHPQTLPADTLRFNLSFGLGGLALTLCLLLLLSGALLLLVYQPGLSSAYSSLQAIVNGPSLVRWVRNVHYLSANLLVIVASLHLLRAYFTGATDTARRLNWVVGVLMLVLILSSNLTGYLLPWDQLSYWAITICTSMLEYVPLVGEGLQQLLRGGAEVGATTLNLFFVLHVFFFPLILIILSVWHFWLVRRAGGLIRRPRGGDARVLANPDLVVRELAVGLTAVAIVLYLAMLWNAPLLAEANPGLSPNPAKAPWYFLGFQELLMHLHPAFAVSVAPLLLLGLLLVPYLRESALPPGEWLVGAGTRAIAGCFAGLGLLLTLTLVIVDDMVLRNAGSSAAGNWLWRGLLPFGVGFAGLGGISVLLRRRLRFSRAQAALAIFVFVVAALLCLTAVGIFFRGEEMLLVWSW